jgi:hypothetical protein
MTSVAILFKEGILRRTSTKNLWITARHAALSNTVLYAPLLYSYDRVCKKNVPNAFAVARKEAV